MASQSHETRVKAGKKDAETRKRNAGGGSKKGASKKGGSKKGGSKKGASKKGR